MKLSDKHKRFCDEYLSNGFNATQAYKSVYKVSDKVAGSSGPRLMENVRVKEYIQKQQEKTANKLEITREQVLQDLIFIKEKNIEDWPPHALKALEMINKMLGFNEPDKQEITLREEPPLFSDEDLDDAV